MMEQIHQQSNAEASPPLLVLLRQTGAPGMPALAGAGRMPGLHRRLGGLCHVRAGQTGSSCWEVREFGFVCKAGRGGERLRGSRQPPVSPSRGWCCFFF